jgi:hypothetical protein
LIGCLRSLYVSVVLECNVHHCEKLFCAMFKPTAKRAGGGSRGSCSKSRAVSQDSGINQNSDSCVSVSSDNLIDDADRSVSLVLNSVAELPPTVESSANALISSGVSRNESAVPSVTVNVSDRIDVEPSLASSANGSNPVLELSPTVETSANSLISSGVSRIESAVPAVTVNVSDRIAVEPPLASSANGNNPVPPLQLSPSNRQRFMANRQPLRVCCDLRNVGLHAAGVRFSFQAVVFVVYPPSEKPNRRHVLLVDQFGCTGLTVWGAHVPLFTFATVGSVVKFTKLGMVMHNGKKVLSMGKDTNVVFLPHAVETDESKWWQSFCVQPFKRIIDIHDCEDNDIVHVAGIVGSLSSETKRVRSDNKDLMNMRLTDQSGFVDVRSWNHSEDEFKAFLEKPLMLQRVRVTSFAGVKVLEILDGNGTAVVSKFDGMEELAKNWSE